MPINPPLPDRSTSRRLSHSAVDRFAAYRWFGVVLAVALTVGTLGCRRGVRDTNRTVAHVGAIGESDTLTNGPPPDTTRLCPRCTIDVKQFAEIGSDSDTVFAVTLASIAEGADQHFYVGPIFERGRVAEFDWNGRFVRRISRRGDGPGEMPAIGSVMAVGDSSLALFGFNRVVWWPLSGRKPVTEIVSHTLSSPTTIALPHHRIAAASMTTDLRTFVVFDSTGAGLTFGDTVDWTPGAENSVHFGLMPRILAPDGDRFLALTEEFAPILEVWTISGTRLRRLRLPAPWFTPYGPALLRELRQRGSRAVPHTYSTGLWKDRAGYIWTVTKVPDPDWSFKPSDDYLQRSESGGTAPKAFGYDRDSVMDAVVAVYAIGDSGARLISAHQLDAAIDGFLSDSVLYQEKFPDNRISTFRLYRLRHTQFNLQGGQR